MHVFNSRDTRYPELVPHIGGVDVTLNSLTSSGMVGASMVVLFLKIDITIINFSKLMETFPISDFFRALF